jgi:hypothetical protein
VQPIPEENSGWIGDLMNGPVRRIDFAGVRVEMKFISHEPDLEAGLGKRPAAIVLSGVVILLIVGLT